MSAAHASSVLRAPTPLRRLLREVLTIPTVSYREQLVAGYVLRFAARRGLDASQDRYGNVYVRYRRGRGRRRPLVLGAHMDHPGFVVTAARGRRLALEFRGGLAATYGRGERLRLYTADDGAERGTATIASVRRAAAVRGRERRIAGAGALLDAGATAEAGDFALWDVVPYRVRGRTVHARQCDDLAGCVAVLAALDRAWAEGADGDLIGLFTRAEEVGLRGAAAAARGGLLPADALVIALETSSGAGGRAVQGGGPIVRVGDAQHVFSPQATQWMTALAQALAAEDPRFRFQRRLMDGGTTEATAYDLLGYETGAACVALGNYHNAGPRGRVAAETIDLRDLEGLVRLCGRMLAELPRYARAQAAARRRWQRLGREAERALQR